MSQIDNSISGYIFTKYIATIKHLPFRFIFIILFLSSVFITAVQAFNDHQRLIIATETVANSGGNSYDEALVLKHINDIHVLRRSGAITDAVYQRAMVWHAAETLKIAGSQGVISQTYVVTAQKVSSDKTTVRTGSDIDFHISRRDGQPMTLEELKRVDRAYRRQFNKVLTRRGGPGFTPAREETFFGTDFMVAWDATTEAEYNRMYEYHKSKGSDTYKRYEAAKVEDKIRTGDKIDYRDGGMYINEMLEQTDNKQSKIDKLKKKMSGASDNKKTSLQNQIDGLVEERNKYIERINTVNNKMAKQAGVQPSSMKVSADSDLQKVATRQYIDIMGKIGASTKSTSIQRQQIKFTMALKIYDLPKAEQKALLEKLPAEFRKQIKVQIKQFHSEPINRNETLRIQNFLKKSAGGRKLLAKYNLVFKELTKERSRRNSTVAIGDVFKSLNETSKHIGNYAHKMNLWLNIIRQVRDAKTDADLAISLGKTFASKTYYGLVAGYLYTGLVEQDGIALAKGLTILLCPHAALPEVVKSIGDASIDIVSGILFDRQFMALYAVSEFDSDTGTLVSVGDYNGGNPVNQLLIDVLDKGDESTLEGIFERATALAKSKNLSVEVTQGISAISVKALVKALSSTVYDGAPLVLKSYGPLASSCMLVANYTQSINDFTEVLGYTDTIPTDIGNEPSWLKKSIYFPKLESAEIQALVKLLELRSEAWKKVKINLSAGITKALVSRHQAELALTEDNGEKAEKMSKRIEAIFKELKIYTFGMKRLEVEGGTNFVMRKFITSIKDQNIKKMKALLRYLGHYERVLRYRQQAEGYYNSLTNESLVVRPLTKTPPLAIDPEFDSHLAAEYMNEIFISVGEIQQKWLNVKRIALNDQQAELDNDFDKEMLRKYYFEIFTHAHFKSVTKGSSRAINPPSSALYVPWQILSGELFKNERYQKLSSRAFEKMSDAREKRKQLRKEFRDYYQNIKPELAIKLPMEIEKGEGITDYEYYFIAKSNYVPKEATYTWYVNDKIIKKGNSLEYIFEKSGEYKLRLVGSWEKPGKVEQKDSIDTNVSFQIKILEEFDSSEEANTSSSDDKDNVVDKLKDNDTVTVPQDLGVETGEGSENKEVKSGSNKDNKTPESIKKPEKEEVPKDNDTVTIPQDKSVETGDGQDDSIKSTPSCSYKYTKWGKCSRETKEQIRKVIVKEPAGCVEWDKPVLTQGCTPPLTAAEKKLKYFKCLCSSYYTIGETCGGTSSYYNTGGQSCGGAMPCACWHGSWSCDAAAMPTSPKTVKTCYASAYGIEDPSPQELKKALQTLKEENRKHMKPLKVMMNYDKCPLHVQLGDMLDFSISPEGGLSPYEVSWSGEGLAEGNKFSFIKTTKPGSFVISSTVADSDGNSATAECQVIVDAVSVEIIKTSPEENTLPVGSKASFKAIVKSGKDNMKGELKYLWEPNPDVQFGDEDQPQFETKTPYTTATYKTVDTYKMWVSVLKKLGDTYNTIGVSNQILMEIIAPDIKLSIDKKNPLVGEKVLIKVQENPAMDDEMITFWWEIKGGETINAGPEANVPNGRAYSFIPKIAGEKNKVTVTVHAKAKNGGADLGEASISIKALEYKVVASPPKRLEKAPWKWDIKQGKAVELPQAIAVFQNAEVHCTITPKPKEKVRYQWTVDKKGCSISAPGSKSTNLNAHETGTYTVSVKVSDKNGVSLGQGSTTLTVTVSQRDLDVAKQKAEDQKKAQELLKEARKLWEEGKLQQAIGKAAQAQKLVGKDKVITKTLKAMQIQKKQLDDKLIEASSLIKQGKLDGAKKVLDSAAMISAKYEKYKEALKQLADAKKKAEEKKKQIAKLLKDAKVLKDAGKLDEALSVLKKGSKQFSGNKEIDKLFKKVVQQQNDARIKMTEGQAEWKKGMLDKAVSTLKDAVKIDPSNKQIEKVMKGMQGQKKMMDDTLKKVDKLIEEKKFDQAKSILKKVERISSKYPPYTGMLKKLDSAKQKELAEILKKATILKDAGKLNESVEILKKGSKQFPENKKIDKLLKDVQKQQNDAKKQEEENQNKLKEEREKAQKEAAEKDKKAKKLINDGYGLEGKGDFEGALGKYRKAQEFDKSPQLESHISKIEKKLKTKEPSLEALAHAKGFAGDWDTNYGEMHIKVIGIEVIADYTHDKGGIKAVLSKDGKTMKGRWEEAPSYKGPRDAGRMYFTLSKDRQQINGLWEYGEKVPSKDWHGTRIVDSQLQPPVIDQPEQKIPNEIKQIIKARYIGCYRDKGANESTKGRDINGYYLTSGSMTIDKCTTSCLERGFKYAGAQYAYGCFCGNSYGRNGKADNCNMPCTGNKNEICGGAWANSVYALTGTKDVEDSTLNTSKNISSLIGSWSFGRSKYHGKPVQEHLCNLTLTDELVEGIGYKIKSCHANESYWILEGKILLFVALDGTITTRFTEVKPNYWEGTYVGSAHSGAGVVHYLKKSDDKTDITKPISTSDVVGKPETRPSVKVGKQTISAKYGPPSSANTWVRYSIPLTAEKFGVDSQTFQKLLANVSMFRIATEMHNGKDFGSIDSVKIGNTYSSNFNAGSNGWNAAGDGTMQWMSTGGTSGGYLQVSDWASGELHWAVAPVNWSGDWQRLIGSSIDFYYKTDHPSYAATVEISSKQQNRLGLVAKPMTILPGSTSSIFIYPYPVSQKDLVISLKSSHTGCSTVLREVVVPAGEKNVEIEVSAKEGVSTCNSVITAWTKGYGESRITLSVDEKAINDKTINDHHEEMVMVSGKTKTSTTYTPNTKGDVFNGGHWAGSSGGNDWLQKDFSSPQLVAGIYIGRASTDIRTKGFRLILKLKKPSGEWITIDELHDTNINRTSLSGGAIGKSIPSYTKKLSPAIKATAFRLEFYGNGWFDATDIRIYTSKETGNDVEAKKAELASKIKVIREQAENNRKEKLAGKIKKIREAAKAKQYADEVEKSERRAQNNTRQSSSLEYNINRGGSDYKNFDLLRADPILCQDACIREKQCKAWTYVKPNTTQGSKPRCWLKYRVPAARKAKCCISGVVMRDNNESPKQFAGSLFGSWSGKGIGDWKGWTSNGTFTMNISESGKISGNYSGDDKGKLTGSVSASGKLNMKSGGGSAGAGTWGGAIKVDVYGKLKGSGTWNVDSFKGTWHGNGK